MSKVVVVTGGTSGIGAGIVRRFVAEGARVIATGLNLSEVETENTAGVRYLSLDVAEESGWRTIANIIDAEYGRLDVLVNNAGIVSHQPIAEIDLDTWQLVLNTNLTGVMLGCRIAIEIMRNNPGGSVGSIINTGSTTSFLGLANDATYTTTKAGVVGLTKSVATWCAQQKLNIRCNSLHPGATATPILQKQIEDQPELAEIFAGMSPYGRLAQVDEIAQMALFLASDDSSYATGAQFVVDGGLTSAHPGM